MAAWKRMDTSAVTGSDNNWRVAQAFDLTGTTNTVGAPLFARFAKGGSLERRRNGACADSAKTRVGSIATRPCQERKDGAPSGQMAYTTSSKGGPTGSR